MSAISSPLTPATIWVGVRVGEWGGGEGEGKVETQNWKKLEKQNMTELHKGRW